MSEPTITVRHDEAAVEVQAMCSPVSQRVGLDVDASITYGVGQHMEALAAVDRLAESLRRQIADAAESPARPMIEGIAGAEAAENIASFQRALRENWA